MRAVIQRASSASLTVDGETMAQFDEPGLVVLVGVTHTDGEEQVATVVRKVAELRLLDGEVSVTDADAPVLVVSQFTLYADVRKGRRPSWNAAAPAQQAEPLVDAVVAGLRDRGVRTSTGVFGAHMRVQLTNDGPVTIIVDA